MFSKSLIQFSVDGQNCVPSLLLDLRPNYGGSNEDIWDLLQKVPWCTAGFSAPNLVAGCCWSMPLLETPGHSLVCLGHTHGHVCISYLWGHCAFLLGPGAHKVLFVPYKSLFPQSCVSSGGSMMALMATSSKSTNTISRSAAPGAPDPAEDHLHRRYSDTVLALSLWVGHAFCALPRSEQLRGPSAWQMHHPRWAMHLNHLPGPSSSVFQLCHESTFSGVPYVSSGELNSGCDPPERCQPSRTQ